MLPWTEDPALAYEHLHRYAFAAPLAEDRRVLDLGCGEGYGSALLASRAASVVGVDVDVRAVDHAATAYGAPNLSFSSASADDLSAYGDAAFDLVVCFELIEHVEAQERVIAEARRVLGEDGLLVCSTPERDVYRDRTGECNPFHVRELNLGEFRELLGSAFPNVALWAQQTLTGSLLEPLNETAAPGAAVYLERDGEYWEVRERPHPLYVVAVASAGALPAAGLSVLADPALLLFEQQRARAERAERELHEARVERAEAEERLQGYRTGMERREAEVREVVATADALRAEAQRYAAELMARNRRIAEIENSPSWRALEAGRARLRHPDGTPNAAGRAASTLLAAVARRLPERDRHDPQ